MCQRHEIKTKYVYSNGGPGEETDNDNDNDDVNVVIIRSDLNSFVRNKEFAAYNLLVSITIGLRSKTVASSQNGTIQKDLH